MTTAPTSITRLDLFTLWGRALAHAVGYTAAEAKPLALAWAWRRTDLHGRQPREGFTFGGYVFERFERPAFGRGVELGFTAHGAVRWASSYDATRLRIGEAKHDELLERAAAILYGESIERLDRTTRAATILNTKLNAIGVAADRVGFRAVRIDRVLVALREGPVPA